MLRRIKKKGLTLTELIFVIAALSIFLLALVNITIGGLRAYRKGKTQTDMKQELRASIDRITTDVRQAIPGSGTSGITAPSYATSNVNPSLTLEFTRYARDKDSSSDFASPDKITVSYELDSTTGKLIRTETTGDDTVVQTLAEDLYIDTGNPEKGSYFKWDEDPMDSTKSNLSVLVVNLVMKRWAGGRQKDTLNLKTKISIRSDVAMQDGAGGDPYGTHTRQEGSYLEAPSSLQDPRL